MPHFILFYFFLRISQRSGYSSRKCTAQVLSNAEIEFEFASERRWKAGELIPSLHGLLLPIKRRNIPDLNRSKITKGIGQATHTTGLLFQPRQQCCRTKSSDRAHCQKLFHVLARVVLRGLSASEAVAGNHILFSSCLVFLPSQILSLSRRANKIQGSRKSSVTGQPTLSRAIELLLKADIVDATPQHDSDQ